MSTNEAETRARLMGWTPKEQYVAAGHKESNWLAPEAYLERGDNILPMLQANNKKLTDRLSITEAELQSTKQLLTAAGEAIEELKNFRTEINKDKVKDKKTEVLAAIAEAKRNNDVDTEVQLTDQLSEINASLKTPAPAPEKKLPEGPKLTPEAQQWATDNPWFGTDQRKTGYAQGLANEWRAQGKQLGTKAFFDHVDHEMQEMFDPNASRRNGNAKVDGGGGTGGGSGGNGKTFADLPPEAKAACEKSASRLVGPGRAYKTKEEWRKRYAEIYDWS